MMQHESPDYRALNALTCSLGHYARGVLKVQRNGKKIRGEIGLSANFAANYLSVALHFKPRARA